MDTAAVSFFVTVVLRGHLALAHYGTFDRTKRLLPKETRFRCDPTLSSYYRPAHTLSISSVTITHSLDNTRTWYIRIFILYSEIRLVP